MAENLQILEIGVGRADFDKPDNVFWGPAIGELVLQADTYYVGIDIGYRSSPYCEPGTDVEQVDTLDKAMHSQWRNSITRYSNTNTAFMQADAANMPFADSSFDRIIMNNLLGGEVSCADLRAILEEVRRTLRLDGMLVLHDDWMPDIYSLWRLQGILEQAGIVLDEAGVTDLSVKDCPREYDQVNREYGFPDKSRGCEELRGIATLWIVKSSAIRDMHADAEANKQLLLPVSRFRDWVHRITQYSHQDES